MRVNIGVAYWLLVNLSGMATAAYQTFLQWGLAAGGSQASGLLLTPSPVVDLGFQIAAPLQDAATRMTGIWGVFNMPQIMLLDLAAAAIVVAFPLVALALMVAQIEYHLSVMVGAVLIPFGIFGPTAFLTEFCIGWITGGLLRVLVTAVLVGIGFPLFSTAVVGTTAGGNPTYYSAMIVALVSFFYAGLAWWVPEQSRLPCVAGWPWGSVALRSWPAPWVSRGCRLRRRRPCMACPR